LPEDVRERLALEGFEHVVLVDFQSPPPPRCKAIHRSHPIVSILAETLLERTLAANADESSPDPSILGRVGCWHAPNVQVPTTIALLRLRHQLVTTRAGQSQTLLVEEAAAIAWSSITTKPLEGTDAFTLLVPTPVGDPPPAVRSRFAARALDELAARRPDLEAFAERRARTLLEDHRRVRDASAARGSHAVKALLPPDVIGLFVLLPPVETI
jgi:thiol-disulfide isomerase/thioredoxin